MWLKQNILLQVLFTFSLKFYVESRNFKIVGGKAISITQSPHQAVYYSNNDFVCSGSLIAPQFILTAAHCTYYFPSSITVRLGTAQRDRDGIRVMVSRYIVHPDFNFKTYDYDFALLRLTTPVRYSSTIQAIRLPREGEIVPVGLHCMVSGWGLTSFNDIEDPPLHLLSANVQVTDTARCRNQYLKVSQDVTERMFCASGDGVRDACLGDSGGPLVCNNTLYGIISFGYGCAVKDFPGIYSNVSYIIPWIKRYVQIP